MYEKDFSDKQETDWLKLATKVWNSRILIFKVCSIGAVVGIIIALGTPKEYTASIFVAHEDLHKRSYSDISAWVGMTGDMNSSTAIEERPFTLPSIIPLPLPLPFFSGFSILRYTGRETAPQ
ncbi:MAG: Wzz/FepE/Etk N-terminal domain-containing protein [Bacteroides intestinalis]